MTTPPDKWEAVKELFEAVLEEDPARRSALLQQRCTDENIRTEVERLLAEHEQAGTFLSSPALDKLASNVEALLSGQRLASGELLAGRFRIVDFIAKGGMGEVYEAEDEELREQVALKTIRQEILLQPNAVARFRREVHLARQVTHPNVCRIYDIFRNKSEDRGKQDIVFISMELLHGDHLGKRLQDGGALTIEQALPLITQMGSALAAAHAVGIVHRDFKPQNVVLVPTAGREGARAVVTDFGLALQSETTPESLSFSTGQGLLGTPAYMSPEQIEGRTATPASDIYALGLVIYEMVTGNRPFHGDTPISAAMKRLSIAPTPPRKLKPDLSPRWETVILRCLDRDPAERFANAADVARALAGEDSTPSSIHKQQTSFRWRQLVALVAALLVVLVSFQYWMKQRRANSVTAASIHRRRSVAVVGFKNLSQRSEEAWLSTALSYQLTTALAAGEQVRTVPGETLEQMKVSLALEDSEGYGRETLTRIQRMVDVDEVLVGSYLALGKETGGKVHLNLRLQNVGDGETIAAIVEEGTEDQLPELVSHTSDAVLQRLGVHELNPTQTNELKASISSSLEANRLYAEGLANLRAYDAVLASDLLQRAVAADPSYAPAHSALSLAWTQLGYEDKSAEEARKASDLSASMPREERLKIEARYHEVAHQWDKAIDVYHALFEFFPDNIEYGLALSAAQLNGGKPRDALNSLAGLRALPSSSGDKPRIDLGQSLAFENLGELSAAQAAATRAVESARSQGARLILARADIQLCFVFSNLGNFPAAKSSCEEAEHTYAATPDRGGLARALMNTGNLLADEGEFAGAKTKYEKAITNYRQIGNKIDLAWALNNLGTAIIELSDLTGARRVHEEALALFRETQQKRGQAASYNNLSDVAQKEGSLGEASSYLEHALAIQREVGDKRRVGLVLRNLAEVDYSRGRLKESRNHAQEAADAGRTAGSKEILADALTSISSIQSAEDQTEKAIKTLEGAEAIYAEMGHKRRLAYCWTASARLSMDEGKVPEAQQLAQRAIEAYHTEKDSEDEALSRLVLSQVFLAGGKVSAAQEELSLATALSPNNSARQTKWALIRGTASVRAASGAFGIALHDLESIRVEIERLGNMPELLETRLSIGRINLKLRRANARADLTRLEHEARTKGFLLLARKAAEASRDL